MPITKLEDIENKTKVRRQKEIADKYDEWFYSQKKYISRAEVAREIGISLTALSKLWKYALSKKVIDRIENFIDDSQIIT